MSFDNIVNHFFESCEYCIEMNWESDYLGGFWNITSTKSHDDITIVPEQNNANDLFGRDVRGRKIDWIYTKNDWKNYSNGE